MIDKFIRKDENPANVKQRPAAKLLILLSKRKHSSFFYFKSRERERFHWSANSQDADNVITKPFSAVVHIGV